MKGRGFPKSNALSFGTFLVCLLSFQFGFAQTSTSAIKGVVKDPQASVVAGATVTLRNTETNYSRRTTSNDSGQFFFEGIQPDTYTIEVEAKGFKKSVFNEVHAFVAKSTDLEIAMELGNVTETISVTVGAVEAIVNSQDASLGNNFGPRQISQLPLNARNVANLLSLQPAVTPSGYVAGGRSDQANLRLDGIDVNEQETGDAFTPVLRVSPDTVEEFRVTTSNPNANQGRSSGAQIEFVTKSGSNEWHGNLFEYHRNTIFTANDFFNNSSILDGKSLPRPVLLRNSYGGTLGGPAIKDSFFFFYNYEARKDSSQLTVNRIVPLASLGQGLLKFRAQPPRPSPNAPLPPTALVTLTTAQLNQLTTGFNNTTQTPTGDPLVDVNPFTVGVLAQAAGRYPANNFRIGDGLNTGGFQFNASVPVSLSAHVVRLDYNLTKDGRHVGFFRGNYQQDVTASASQFPDTITPNTWSHPYGFVTGHTLMISNTKINNFKYGLTREAFTNQGDSTLDAITFRSVFASNLFSRSFSRTTPVQNLTDDLSWVKGNHSLSFGTNIRITRNNREDFAQSYDNGMTNQAAYQGMGTVLSNPIIAWLPHLTGLPVGTTIIAPVSNARAAVSTLIGRLPDYTANFNFDVSGTLLALNAPVIRSFATEEYHFYGQDIWRIKDNVTFTYGLGYGLSRPVYERNGLQTRPNIPLAEYLRRRQQAAMKGQNYDEPITVNLAGPKHNAPGFYDLDKNNFQPRIAIAWSPAYQHGWFSELMGTERQSTFRAGFAVTNDYFGQALAVNFDGNNILGFASRQRVSGGIYNVTTNPGPLITSLGMSIRGLPGITIPANLSFPQTHPQDLDARIEGSLDTNLVSPINYSWNLTYSRQFGKGIVVETSYIARIARNLLATRDVMQLNNIVDPKSGMDWNSAATLLEQYRVARTPVANIPTIPFFENMWAPGELDALFFGAGLTNTQAVYGVAAISSQTPGCAGPPLFRCYDNGNDWTTLQQVLEKNTSHRYFFQSQYGALSAFGTIGHSDYHGVAVSVRQRFKGLTWDFNYTFSKSIDDASGLQTSGVFGRVFILNALRQHDNRAVSDFDMSHIMNANSIWDLPFGRGRKWLNNSNNFVNAVIGGWTLTSIFRYNSGLPFDAPLDLGGGFPTNWNVRSWTVPIKEVKTSPTRGPGTPNLFSDPKAVYNSFRSPQPGETGARNIFRYPGFISLDAGLYKSFNMPWSEKHKFTIRWETFNVTNTQHFTGNANNTTFLDPQFGSPVATFGNFTSIQGTPRVMQFALRYDF